MELTLKKRNGKIIDIVLEDCKIITPINLGQRDTLFFLCKKCGNIFSYNTVSLERTPRCRKCFPISESLVERDFGIFVNSFGVEVIRNSRDIISPLELDFFIPEKQIAFEINGLYWHSESMLLNKGHNPRQYHLSKTLRCEEKNIQLIQIFEDEWKYSKDIVKSVINNLFYKISNKVGARKTVIKEINSSIKNVFLNENHLLGADASNVKLGAFYNDVLLSVMTFTKPRHFMGGKKEENVWELSRFSSLKNFMVFGVASKLLSYFVKNYNPKRIYSYSDRRWFSGKLYKKLGFNFDGYVRPNYWYFKNGRREYRYKYRKYNLGIFDNTTERERMIELGFERIYDCGLSRWMLYLYKKD